MSWNQIDQRDYAAGFEVGYRLPANAFVDSKKSGPIAGHFNKTYSLKIVHYVRKVSQFPPSLGSGWMNSPSPLPYGGSHIYCFSPSRNLITALFTSSGRSCCVQ